MKIRMAAIAVCLLCACGVGVSTWAQTNRVQVAGRMVTAPALIVSGSDIGFRVTGSDGTGTVTGEWLVRVNGEWRRVENALALPR